jgi:hypothetical protein
MKRKFTIALLGMALLFSIKGQGQSIAPFALNVAGGSFDNPSSYTRYEWSFGELVLIDTYTSASDNLILTNGLLQPCTEKITGDFTISYFGKNEWKVFPNITTGSFELDFFLTSPGLMQLQLTDAMGRVINTRKFDYHCCNRIERYDISNLADGVYFINASFTISTQLPLSERSRVNRQGTFRIVKAR